LRVSRISIIATGLFGVVFALSAQGAQAATVRGHWSFDEIGSATATDDSGNNNNGNSENIIGDGQGYVFDGADSRVIVPSSASLNPGSSDFSFGLTLTTTTPAPGTDYDVIRKGLANSVGGEFKIEVVPRNGLAKAFCIVKDSAKHSTSVIWGPKAGLNDGQQHTITCSKVGNTLRLQVDAYPTRTKTNAAGIGSISNTAKLSIGAKAEVNDPSADWFLGEIYDAFVS
jgi:hypothetical protein